MFQVLNLFQPGLSYLFANAAEGAHPKIGFGFDLPMERSSSPKGGDLDQKVVKLYDALRPLLYRYLISTGHSPQDVEEIVQETFLRLYTHLRGAGGEENIRSWIFQVAHNLGANLHKGRRRVVETTPEMWEQLSHSIVDRTAGPEETVLRKERISRVHERLERLTPLQRDCLFLRIEGFRYREIGEMLKVGTSTVSGSLRNAINSLIKGAS